MSNIYIRPPEANILMSETTQNNVMNPQNIKRGDKVRLLDDKGKPTGPVMKVQHVGGTYNNKVYCAEIGHEVYAQCFKRVGGRK